MIKAENTLFEEENSMRTSEKLRSSVTFDINHRMIYGLCAFFAFFMDLYCSFLYESFQRTGHFRYLFMVISCAFYILFCASVLKRGDHYEIKQITKISITLLILQSFMIPSLKLITDQNTYYVVIHMVAISFTMLIAIWVTISNPEVRRSVSNFLKKALYMKKKNSTLAGMGMLIVLLGIVLCLCYQQGGYYFLWDSHDLFEAIDAADPESLASLDRLTFSGHISYSLISFLILLKQLTGSAVEGQTLMGVCLLLIGITSFWKLIQLYDRRTSSQFLYILLTAMFAFSPYMLGMVTYSYPDYAMWCLAPLLYYYAFSGKWIECFAFGTVYCFIKEPCVVIYGSLLILLFVIEAIRTQKWTKHLKRYFVMSVPLFVWLFCYIYVGHWDGVGGFTWNREYMVLKTHTLFNINFNWILLVFDVTFLVVAITVSGIRKQMDAEQWMQVIITFVSLFLFWLFSVSFSTVVHPRYADAIVAQLYIISAFAVETLAHTFFSTHNRLQYLPYAVVGAFTVLLGFSSFYTIDPLMRKTFEVCDVGMSEMGEQVITTGQILSDGWVYNRQYQNFAIAVDKALSSIPRIGAEGKIFTPAVDNCTWYFNAMGYYSVLGEEGIREEDEKWNHVRRSRMTDTTDPDNIDLVLWCVSNPNSIELSEDEKGYLLWTDYAGQDLYQYVTSEFSEIMTKSFESHGWVVNCTTFTNVLGK